MYDFSFRADREADRDPEDNLEPIEIPGETATCAKCGSENIEALAFCNVNTREFINWSRPGDSDECYCNQCGDWTTIKWVKKENKK